MALRVVSSCLSKRGQTGCAVCRDKVHELRANLSGWQTQRRLLDGGDLPQAPDAACACAATGEAFDVSTGLTTAVTDGLVTGVHRLTAADPNVPTQAARA